MLRFSLLLFMPGLMVALACAPSKPEVDLNAEKETIYKLTADLISAELRRDMEETLSFLAPDAVAQLAGNPIQEPSIVSGTTEIRTLYEKIFDMPYSDIRWESRDILFPSSGDLAYQSGTMRIVFEGPDATTVVPGEGTIIWRKSSGQWKAAIMHFSMSEPYTY